MHCRAIYNQPCPRWFLTIKFSKTYHTEEILFIVRDILDSHLEGPKLRWEKVLNERPCEELLDSY